MGRSRTHRMDPDKIRSVPAEWSNPDAAERLIPNFRSGSFRDYNHQLVSIGGCKFCDIADRPLRMVLTSLLGLIARFTTKRAPFQSHLFLPVFLFSERLQIERN
jgi:hypothetical protein